MLATQIVPAICVLIPPSFLPLPHSSDENPEQRKPFDSMLKFHCEMILNVSNFHEKDPAKIIVSPGRILSYRSRRFRSYYVLWEDETYSVREIGSGSGHNDIEDLRGGPVTEMRFVEVQCWIRLNDAQGLRRCVMLENRPKLQRSDPRLNKSLIQYEKLTAKIQACWDGLRSKHPEMEF